MKISELITELQKHPEDLEVEIRYYEDDCGAGDYQEQSIEQIWEWNKYKDQTVLILDSCN